MSFKPIANPSKLIRAGLEKYPDAETTGQTTVDYDEDELYGADAIGFALLGFGLTPTQIEDDYTLREAAESAIFGDVEVFNPVMPEYREPVADVLCELVDTHDWEPTRIAAWLEHCVGL